MTTQAKLARAAVVLLLAGVLTSISCMHSATINSTDAQTKALLTINQTVAAISTGNEAVAQGVISVQAANLISQAEAKAILDWSRNVALAVEASEITLKAVTAKSIDWPTFVIQIQADLNRMSLPDSVKPYLAQTTATPPLVISLVRSIQTIVQSITVAVTTAQGAK